jgi:hypothetical protein
VTDEIIAALIFIGTIGHFDYQLFVIRTHRVCPGSRRITLLTYLFHTFIEVEEGLFHILLLEVNAAEIYIGENSLEDDIVMAFKLAMGRASYRFGMEKVRDTVRSDEELETFLFPLLRMPIVR